MSRRRKLRIPAALSVVLLAGSACDSDRQPSDASARDAGIVADATEQQDAAPADAGQMDAEPEDTPVI